MQPELKKIKQPLGVNKESLEKDKSFDLVLDNPEITSYTALDFKLEERTGRELRPGHRIGFIIPKDFQNRIVRDVILKHRKDQKYVKDIGVDKYDPYGAYSLVEFHDDKENSWLGWKDPKGRNPAKFAEPRPAGNPESEILHDWVATVGKINADAVRLTNIGENPDYSVSQIHGLEIVFFPELGGVEYQERIYCKDTSFIDLEKNKLLPSYGGGSFTEGKYEGALALNKYGETLYPLGKDENGDIMLEGEFLKIDLQPGKSLIQVEVALGDTEHLKEVNPKTGRHTRLGYAKLWVGIERADTKKVNWFIRNANVPPQGVIAGGPHKDIGLIKKGDKLIIKSEADTSYIMGWRLAYKNK